MEITFEGKITTIGKTKGKAGSLAIVIPKKIVDGLNLSAGDKWKITVKKDDSLIVKLKG